MYKLIGLKQYSKSAYSSYEKAKCIWNTNKCRIYYKTYKSRYSIYFKYFRKNAYTLFANESYYMLNKLIICV